MSAPGRPEDRAYVLGHTPREHDRLDLQGAIYRDATRRAMVDAGISPGMRVLDLGCGSGDVALLAGELVGRSGAVVGVDRDEGAVAAARERAAARGAPHVTFHVGEVGAPTGHGTFDAVVGRFVLMHQEDPAGVLAGAVRGVRSGGPVVLVESHMAALRDGIHSLPPSALYERVVRWKCAVVGGAGADLEAGLRLPRTFRAAGLPDPRTRMDVPLAAEAASPLYRYMAESVRSMLPLARRLGVEGFEEEDLEVLAEGLRAEVEGRGCVLVGWPVVAAWCARP